MFFWYQLFAAINGEVDIKYREKSAQKYEAATIYINHFVVSEVLKHH
jgi:hypothetical protein